MLFQILSTRPQSPFTSFESTLREADRKYLITPNQSLNTEKSGQLPLLCQNQNAILNGLSRSENPFIAFLHANKSYSSYFGITVLEPKQPEGINVLRELTNQDFLECFLNLASSLGSQGVLELIENYVNRTLKRFNGEMKQTEIQIKKHPHLFALAVRDFDGAYGLTAANLKKCTTTRKAQITPYTLPEKPEEHIDFTKPPINMDVLNARVRLINGDKNNVSAGTLNTQGEYQLDWTEEGKKALDELLQHSNGWLSAFLT